MQKTTSYIYFRRELEIDKDASALEISPWLKHLWMTFLIVFGLFIRVNGAKDLYYNGDEITHVSIANGETIAQVLRYSLHEVHPPLLYILIHYWIKISTNPEFVRCLPLIFGMALIPLYYLIGRLINGELCGLCCASLITFSMPCIEQSFLVRHYSLLLLFCSLSLYFYLQWKKDNKSLYIILYLCCGCFSVLSEHSAVFFYFSLTLFEAVNILLYKNQYKRLTEWLLVNFIIATLEVYIYHFWQGSLSDYELYPSTVLSYQTNAFPWEIFPDSAKHPIAALFSSPFIVCSYLYPEFPLLPIILFAAFAPSALRQRMILLPLIMLTGVMCLVCMIIYEFGLYPAIASRHSLWAIPLLIPAAGGVGADMAWRKTETSGFRLRIFIVFIFLSAGYSFATRLKDKDEYTTVTLRSWRGMTSILDTLGPTDLIVTGNIGIHHLINSFQYRDDAGYDGKSVTLVPYHKAYLLYSSRYFNVLDGYRYGGETMLATLIKAQREHLLDNIDNIVFVNWGLRTPFYGLGECPYLRKNILYQPEAVEYWAGGRFPYEELGVLSVPKQAIINYLLSPYGLARTCING